MGWGIFGKGDTKNETTQNTDYDIDNSVTVASDGGVLVREGSAFNQTNVMTDGGMVKSATDAFLSSASTVQQAIDANNVAVKASLAIADGTTDKVFGLAEKAGGGAFHLAHETQKNTNAFAAEALQRMNEATSAAIASSAQAGRDALAANKAVQDSAFAVVNNSTNQVAKTAFEAVGMASHVADFAAEMATKYGKTNSELAALAVGQVKSAWSDAQQAQANKAGGDYRMLMWALAAVVGLVAVKSFSRGG